jgi:hypothetical protein
MAAARTTGKNDQQQLRRYVLLYYRLFLVAARVIGTYSLASSRQSKDFSFLSSNHIDEMSRSASFRQQRLILILVAPAH